MEIRSSTGIQSIFRINPFCRRNHFGQQVIVDALQLCFSQNSLSLSDVHLEIIARILSFQKIIYDPVEEAASEEILFASNFDRKKRVRYLKSRRIGVIDAERAMLGLTSSTLLYQGIMCSARFQATLSTLSASAFHNETDALVGIKENLIFGTKIPIGINSNFSPALFDNLSENQSLIIYSNVYHQH